MPEINHFKLPLLISSLVMYKVAREVNYIPIMTKPEENADNAIFFSKEQILCLIFKYVSSTYLWH